jgi:hypothetical protein
VKRNTKLVGNISELAVMMALRGLGYELAVPWGDSARYDLLADKDGVISRVQVKTGRLTCGAVEFNCYSSHAHRGGSMRTYQGEIDYFGVYCPKIEAVLLVPISEAPGSTVYLRWQPAKNGQRKKIRWAKDYIISSQPMPTLGTWGADAVSNAAESISMPS